MSFGHNAQLDNFPHSLSIFCTESCILPNMKDQTSRQLKESLTSLFTLKPFDYSRDLGMESLKHSWNEKVKMWIQKEHRQNKTLTLTVFRARFIISTLRMTQDINICVHVHVWKSVFWTVHLWFDINPHFHGVRMNELPRMSLTVRDFSSRLRDYFTWSNSRQDCTFCGHPSHIVTQAL